MKSIYSTFILLGCCFSVKSQNVGIGTTVPLAKLHVAESNVLFSKLGTYGAFPNNPPISGTGIRMMWYAEKGAFRTGYVNGTQWDKDNIGYSSAAFGSNTTAVGFGAFAAGNNTSASSNFSFAMGENTIASGITSTALGYSTTASGQGAFASGQFTLASGSNSGSFGYGNSATNNNAMAFGLNTAAKSHSSATFGLNSISKSDYSLVAGQFNDTLGSFKLFEVGCGTSNSARKNALTVVSSGNVGIGTVAPTRNLEIVGSSVNPITLSIANRAGFGAGSIEFVSDYGLVNQWRPAYMQTTDLGNFTGTLQFFTNGVGSSNLYGRVLNFELRNGLAYTATGTVSSYSDARLKHSVTAFTDGLNIINKINPVQFYYTADAPFASNKQQIGIIAQELELIAPYMVEQNKEGKVDDLRTVNNQAYTFLLINAVKEQQAQIEEHKREQQKQQQQIQQYQEKLSQMQSEIDFLKQSVQQILKEKK